MPDNLIWFPSQDVDPDTSMCDSCSWKVACPCSADKTVGAQEQADYIVNVARMGDVLAKVRDQLPDGLPVKDVCTRMHEILLNKDEELATMFFNIMQLHRGQ